MRLKHLLGPALAAGCLTSTAVVQAEDAPIEEIIVTGSYLKRAPEDAPSPIRVLGREELEAKGRPQLADLVTTLPSIIGSENQSAQEQSVGGAGAANINIRNLGLSSTLVLLEGKRMNQGTSTSNQGEHFVDINRLPFIMVDNIEILKDGASAIYGSDAVAGVANFKLRTDFEGFEIQAIYQDAFKGREVDFDDTGLPEIYREPIENISKDEHSDMDLGVIWGFGNDNTHFVIGGNYFERDGLDSADRERAFATGFEEVETPSPFSFPQDMFAARQLAPGVLIPSTMMINDSSCVALAYYRTKNSGLCSGTADLMSRDIFSEEQRLQLLGTWTHQLNDRVEAYGHFGMSENNIVINQGPSLPLTSQIQFSPDNPGVQFEVFNGLANAIALGDDVANRLVPLPFPVISFIPGDTLDITDPAAVLAGMGPVTFNGLARGALANLQNAMGVPADVDGDGVVEPGEIFKKRQDSEIDRETRLFMIGLRGDINDSWSFDASYSFSSEDSETTFNDTVNERIEDALNGFFGPNCDRGTVDNPTEPGDSSKGCFWFNPFGSSILFPDTVWTDGNGRQHRLGNDPAYVDALFGEGVVFAESELTVLDAVVTTQSLFGWELPGGGVGFAFGAQYRDEERRAGGNELASDPSFPFGFTGPVIPYSAKQDVYAVFAELALPLTDDFEAQLALRYEDYGGDTGDTLDPKLALRWQALESLALRASVGTSFRGPSISQKFGRGTGLQFIAPPDEEVHDVRPGATFGSGVFGRLPTFGNPELEPEESTNFNIGVIWTPIDEFTLSLDYFDYDYDNIIIPEDYIGLANDCQIAWDEADRPPSILPGGAINPDYLAVEPCNFRDLDSDPGTPDILLDPVGNALNVQRTYVNGTNLTASGLDLLSRYVLGTDFGTFGITLDASWFIEYEIQQAVTPFDRRLAPGQTIDMVGLNYTVLVGRPLPEYKASLMFDWSWNQHYASIITNYSDSLTETRAEPEPLHVASHTTVDASYTYSFQQLDLSLTAGAMNLFDREPPTASGFNSYNPTLHDPRGRMWYFRLRYQL
ncbi:MAG TPA: TonB-dependent receptor [Pseudomonadales bacterium]